MVSEIIRDTCVTFVSKHIVLNNLEVPTNSFFPTYSKKKSTKESPTDTKLLKPSKRSPRWAGA